MVAAQLKENHPMTTNPTPQSESSRAPARRARRKGHTKTDKARDPVKPRARSRPKADAPTATRSKATKTQACLDLLRRPNGATLEELQQATAWQAHSVRGFLAGTVKKKLGLKLASDKPEDGPRRYRILADRG